MDAVGLAPGGGLTFLVNQARCFAAEPELEFTYFVAPRCRSAMEAVVGADQVRVPFAQAPRLPSRLYWEQAVLPRVLHDERFDVLYAPGGFAVFRSPVPQLVVDHNPYHHAGRKELGVGTALLRFHGERLLARLSARRAEAVVYLSQAFADAMRGVGFPPPTAIIPSGVSQDWPEADASVAAEVVGCQSCQRNGFALAVHNWVPGKQLDLLVRAWAELEGASWGHLVLVGRPIDRSATRRIRAELSDPHVGSRVHVLSSLDRGIVGALYARARVYVSASILEAFPLTPFEAMSFGTPCVLSDTAEHREVARDAAVYFEPGHQESLRHALALAGKRRAEMTERGRQLVSEMTWDRSAMAFSELLTRL